ncbi:MAG: PD-(D/E)XK nuclease family protein [Candidatus Latescibacteria bacterium]|nr:PD-(D/E)XK nuclease family protein [Candidatus Latescibacterota bacterium]
MSSHPLAPLTAFCQAHPHAPKVVFVPSVQAGQHLAAALAAGGRTWGNLRLVTPAEWAARWAGPQLAAAGWRRLSADEEFFLVWEALGVAGRTRALGSADRPSPGLARGLTQTLRILRLNNVAPEALAALASGGERLRALADLYRGYIQALGQHQRYDQAQLFALATGLEGPRTGVFGLFDETMLPELSRRFVQHCMGVGGCRFTWEGAEVLPPVQSAGAQFAALPKLQLPALSKQNGPCLRIWDAAGAEAEIRAVLREMLQGTIPLDQVELVYTTEQPYLGLVHSLAEQLEIEVDAVQGFPPYLSPVGQALTGFYRWVGSGFDPAEMAELCRAGLIGASPQTGPVQLLAPFLRQARAQRRKDGEHEDVLPDEDLEKTEAVLRARLFWNTLRDLGPEEGEISLGALAEAGVRFLQGHVPLSREHDHQVAGLLVDRLRSMAAVQVLDRPSRLAPRLLERLAAPVFPGGGAPGKGRLLVSPLERAGYAGRSYLYIIGMDEGAFPGKPTEDPLLSDAERQQLGVPLQREGPAEQAWQLSRLLACARGPVTLVSKRCELQDGRELTPAPLLLRLAEHDTCAQIPLVVADPAAALDQGEGFLAGCRGSGGAGQAQVLFPWLAEGEHALGRREQGGLGRFSGWLGQPTPELRLNGGRLLRSASSLETLMRCPYRYFLHYVLELEGPPERDEDPGRWLDPAEFGSALHRLFYRFLSVLRDRGERPAIDPHRPLLEELLRELVAELKLRLPVHHEAALRADLRRLERSAQVFLRVESRIPEVDRVEFELGFGAGEHDGASFREGVVLTLSERLQLRLQGRIDRVDRLGEGYQIWDYKTGASTSYEGEDLLRGGIHLQWALYAYALEEILREREHGGRVTSAGYFFVGAREHGRRLSAPPPERELVARYLAPVVEMVEQGAFFHLQKERQCLHCDFASLCGGEERMPGEVDPETAPAQPGLAELLRQWADG